MSVENGPQQLSEPATWISVVITDSGGKPVLMTGQDLLVAETGATGDAITDKGISMSASLQEVEKSQQDIRPQILPSAETASEGRDDEVKTQHPESGSSSFSISIEDDKGNIIVVRNLKETVSSVTDLEVIEESNKAIITWQGRSGVKGFILHRAEKGKDNYDPITNLIPYFGRGDKDIFLYRFTDNTTKPGAKYDYRLERVEAEHKGGLKIGKLAD